MKKFSYSQIFTIAYPILFSTLMEQLVGMTDTAFLGRVGQVELGASALGNIFYMTVFMLGMGFCVGTQILMGRRNGQGKYLSIGKIFYHSLAFLLFMAAVLFGLTHLFASDFLELIIQSPNVCKATESYLNWRVYGFFFAFINILFRSFYVATTHTRTLTLNSVVMVSCNILFNYILIFGKFGVPAFGIAGAALGSTMAEAVSTLFFVIYTHRHVPYAKYGLNILPKFRFHILGKMLGISVWTMVQNFISLSTWFLLFLAVEHLGERELAVTNIIRNISSFTYMLVIAMSSTASTLVSNLMGNGEYEAVRPMLMKTIRLNFIILVPILLLIGLLPDAVMGIFTDDASLIEAGYGPLYMLLFSYVLTIPSQIIFNAVAATGNTRRGLCIEVIALSIYSLYIIVAIFHYKVSLTWCWFSEFVYGFWEIVLSVPYLRSGKWKQTRI